MKPFAASLAAVCLVTSSIAGAAPIAAPTISPLVALSVFATAQSRAALCATTAAAAAAATTTATQGQQQCVLPVVDAPPPAVVSEAPPPAVVEPVAVTEPVAGPNLLPLLIGLGLFAAAFFLLDDTLLGDDDGIDEIDIDPISPA
jgi:hypothetical protein